MKDTMGMPMGGDKAKMEIEIEAPENEGEGEGEGMDKPEINGMEQPADKGEGSILMEVLGLPDITYAKALLAAAKQIPKFASLSEQELADALSGDVYARLDVDRQRAVMGKGMPPGPPEGAPGAGKGPDMAGGGDVSTEM